MGQPVKESEGRRPKERRGREGTVPGGLSGGEEIVMWPMFSLAGVKEEGGKWQKVGQTQAVCGISILQYVCVHAHMCAHVCVCVSVYMCMYVITC